MLFFLGLFNTAFFGLNLYFYLDDPTRVWNLVSLCVSGFAAVWCLILAMNE